MSYALTYYGIYKSGNEMVWNFLLLAEKCIICSLDFYHINCTGVGCEYLTYASAD